MRGVPEGVKGSVNGIGISFREDGSAQVTWPKARKIRRPNGSKISSPAESGWPAWEGRSSQDTARSNGRAC